MLNPVVWVWRLGSIVWASVLAGPVEGTEGHSCDSVCWGAVGDAEGEPESEEDEACGGMGVWV